MPAPSVPGFVAAQDRLRSLLGKQVVFRLPVAATWPEGTKLNPDTGEPYDATIEPTGPAFTEVTKTCLVIIKEASPLRPQTDTETAASGEMSGMDIILDVAVADYPEVEDATEMTVNGLDYRIREAKPFSLAEEKYRWLIYGMQR